MARRSKKNRRKQSRTSPATRSNSHKPAASVADETQRPEVSNRPSATITIRRLFKLAVLITALWWLVLGSMALFTANPVTLNREQILRAEIVVTATVVNPDKGTIHIEKFWKKNREVDSITLEKLNQTGAKTDLSYIIPVTKSQDGRYNVTTIRMPKTPSLIYPNTPEALRQLQSILNTE